MTAAQKVIKYLAIAFAVFLIVTIISSILTAVLGISGIMGLKNYNEAITDEMIVKSFENKNIEKLELEVAYTNLTIKTGEDLKVETNNGNINCKQNNETLQIKEKGNNWFSKNVDTELVLYIPKEIELEKIKIVTGAGKIQVENLNAEHLSLELGAGETIIENLKITDECDIEGGAGKIDIVSATINNLNLDLGVGESNITAILTGDNEINAGIGTLNINLEDNKENYKIKANKGLGNIKIDGKQISDGETDGNGENSIKIEGGIGNINIDFK